MNIQQAYYTRTIVLQNFLDRIVPVRGRPNTYSLKGTITQAERNAVVVGLNEIKTRLHAIRLGGGEEGTSNEQSTG